MKKTFISQSSKEEEKKELQELLGNIKKVFRIRYIVIGGFALLFVSLKLTGVYPLPWLSPMLLLMLIALTAICDLLLRKTKLKETITRANTSYFIFLVPEAIIILTSLHLTAVVPFIGALVLVLVSLVSYFSYTRRNYRLAITIFYVICYTIVVTFEYLGILGFEDALKIGVNVAKNANVFILSLTTGALLIIIISLTVDAFLRRLRVSLATVSQKEKELEEAKSVLEIKVEARTKELGGLAESLEEQVQGRTKELQEKLVELERFQRLAVGRELKMVELKKEIDKLKKELEKNQ